MVCSFFRNHMVKHTRTSILYLRGSVSSTRAPPPWQAGAALPRPHNRERPVGGGDVHPPRGGLARPATAHRGADPQRHLDRTGGQWMINLVSVSYNFSYKNLVALIK